MEYDNKYQRRMVSLLDQMRYKDFEKFARIFFQTLGLGYDQAAFSSDDGGVDGLITLRRRTAGGRDGSDSDHGSRSGQPQILTQVKQNLSSKVQPRDVRAFLGAVIPQILWNSLDFAIVFCWNSLQPGCYETKSRLEFCLRKLNEQMIDEGRQPYSLHLLFIDRTLILCLLSVRPFARALWKNWQLNQMPLQFHRLHFRSAQRGQVFELVRLIDYADELMSPNSLPMLGSRTGSNNLSANCQDFFDFLREMSLPQRGLSAADRDGNHSARSRNSRCSRLILS